MSLKYIDVSTDAKYRDLHPQTPNYLKNKRYIENFAISKTPTISNSPAIKFYNVDVYNQAGWQAGLIWTAEI